MTTLWYFTRGTGAVSLVLLTASVVLGVVDVRRWSAWHVPRFVVDGLHRTVSLLVVLFVGLHVLTAVLDTFAPIRLIDAIVPFAGTYRPFWVGLGAVAFDLVVAIVVTSLLRGRLGPRRWRAVHWFAYACWPVAFMHGLGTGSDVRPGWMLWLSVACAVAVAVAVVARLANDLPAAVTAAAGMSFAGLVLMLWLPSGPLAKGWAKKSGTPSHLLTPGKSR